MSSKQHSPRPLIERTGVINPGPPVVPQAREALTTTDLKAEDRAERHELRRVLNTMDVGFWDWDIPSSQIWYSDYILNLSGYHPADVVAAENFFQMGMHPDDAQNNTLALQALITGKSEDYRQEFRFRHKQGHWLWFESRGKAVARSDEGLALRIFGQLISIDHLKQLQADAAFLLGLTGAMQGIADAMEVEQTAIQQLGEYLGADRVRIAHFDAPRRKLVVTQEWKTPQQAPMIGEWQLLRAESALRDSIRTQTDYLSNDVARDSRITDPESIAFYKKVNCAAFFVVPLLADGDLGATFVVSQATPRIWQPREISLIKDVAQRLWASIARARAQSEQAQSQKLLRFALTSARMSARRINVDTGEVLLSENFHNMLGDDVAEDISTADYLAQVHPDDIQRVLACFLDGQTDDHAGDHRLIATDGSVRHISSVIHFDEKPDAAVRSPRFASTFLRDITDKRQREAEAEKTRLQLLKHSRLSAMGVMASTLAHELNQPLTAAANYLALIENGFETRPDQMRHYAKRAGEKVLEAGLTIRSVRNYAADGALIRRPENLHDMVETALSAMFDFAQPSQISIINAVPENLTVLVDARMVHHAVSNIVRNALDALADLPVGRIEISARHAGEMIDLHIADNGPGIDDDIAAHLFSPFVTTKEQGTGLGLPLCRTMVEANGGKINVIRHDDRGTVFSITLPRAGPEHPLQEGQEH